MGTEQPVRKDGGREKERCLARGLEGDTPGAAAAATAFDAWAVLGDRDALRALSDLAASLRGAGYDSTRRAGLLAHLALGREVPHSAMARALPPRTLDALASAGAIDAVDGRVRLRFRLFAAGSLLAVLPFPHDPYRHVYLGRDSLCLLETVWRRAPGGRAAVDLGTGTGLLAAVLTNRYRLSVGTDLLPTTAACAALTLHLNPSQRHGHRAAACVTDVGAGLRPRSFDLVTCNPPYVPDPTPGSGRSRAAYAHGGPTGYELPERFVREGLALLRGGGLLVSTVLDAQLTDGRRPLPDLCRSLEAMGHTVDIVPLPPHRLDKNWTEHAVAAHPVLASVGLAALLVHPTQDRRPNS